MLLEPKERNLSAARFACALPVLLLLLSTRLQGVDAFGPSTTVPPDLEATQALYNSGQYEQAAQAARIGQELDPWLDAWEQVEAKSLLALGRYEQAYQSLLSHVAERSYDLRARLLLREAAKFTGRETEAHRQLEAIGFLVNERSRRFSYDPNNIVAVGEAALLFNVEPKIVLENFFRSVQEQAGAPVSAFLAAGRLALEKHDYKLASRSFQKGLELHPDNVDLWSGLAASFREGDRARLVEYASKALQINPRHAGTLVLLSEHLIAAEAYEEAARNLDIALSTNPEHPQALALKAVLAYLVNDVERGESYRKRALSTWTSNPSVDYLIGRELSKKYRFQDGATSQRIALSLDPDFTPARIQLAQDLLRLGRNAEAWEHALAVRESDPYDIAAYNLVTLRDKLLDFETLESEHFLIRLTPEEAAVYGARAIRLLEEAHSRLTARYGIELPQKTTVEIYPDPADFETRTFGMPGNPGFLGVCFGPVFTINSPATRSSNWEAVLYHEFCHTITLGLTNNRMPRWLSEGISVYEEQIADPAWGQRMSAAYRDRILSGEMQSISNMSASFLQARDGQDIQFAYFQSYLVVDFIMQQFGLEPVKELLRSLGEGDAINEALAAHLAPLDELNERFVSYAQQQAAQLASDFTFKREDSPLEKAISMLTPQENYSEELQRGQELISEESWQEAIDRLEPLVEKAGYLPGEENAHWPLAQAYRGIGDTEKERQTLEIITEHEASRLGPVVRLLEIAHEQGDSLALFRWSDTWLAISPMAETPWRALLKSAAELGRGNAAIEAGLALVSLEPPDIAALHYQLAQLNKEQDSRAAKRHLLMALEEAPRYQAAYELLASLSGSESSSAPSAAQPETAFDPLEGFDLDHVINP